MLANIAAKSERSCRNGGYPCTVYQRRYCQGRQHSGNLGADGGNDGMERDLCSRNGCHNSTRRGFYLPYKPDRPCYYRHYGGDCDWRSVIQKLGHCKGKASQLGDWIVNVFNNFKEKCSQYIQEFANKFPEAFAFISSVFESFKQTATNIFGGIKTFFQGIIQFFTGVFTGDWSKALEGLKNIFSGAFKALSSLALAPLNALKGVVTGAFNAIDVATGGKTDSNKK